MKIELDKRQYETILKLVYLGDWMVNAIRISDERIKKYDDAAQLVYAHAHEAGCEKYVEWDDKFKRYFPTRFFDEDPEILQYHEEYDEECFWDELFHRLVERDVVRTFGKREVAQMGFEELIQKEEPFRERYDEEFDKHGIDRLIIAWDGLRGDPTIGA